MSRILFFYEISENADAWDIEPVTDELEGLGIAFADDSGFYKSAERRAAESGLRIVICK